MPVEIISRAADAAKSRILPQRGLKRDLNNAVNGVIEHFDKRSNGGPMSSLHANDLVVGKLPDGSGYYVEIDIFEAPIPWHRDRLTIRGGSVSMRQISPTPSSPRQSLPREEVEKIIARIDNVTVPYQKSRQARKEKREKVANFFERAKGRLPAKLGGGTSKTLES